MAPTDVTPAPQEGLIGGFGNEVWQAAGFFPIPPNRDRLATWSRPEYLLAEDNDQTYTRLRFGETKKTLGINMDGKPCWVQADQTGKAAAGCTVVQTPSEQEREAFTEVAHYLKHIELDTQEPYKTFVDIWATDAGLTPVVPQVAAKTFGEGGNAPAAAPEHGTTAPARTPSSAFSPFEPVRATVAPELSFLFEERTPTQTPAAVAPPASSTPPSAPAAAPPAFKPSGDVPAAPSASDPRA